MQDNKKLDYEDFLEKYTPIKNHLCENASFEGCMFETFGEELSFIRTHALRKCIWTVIDCDGWYGITAGYHWINRIGYLITEQEWETDDEEFTICDEGPVNDWFISLAPSKMAEIMGIDQSLIPEEKDEKAMDAWYDLCVDEKEEIMNKYKTDL